MLTSDYAQCVTSRCLRWPGPGQVLRKLEWCSPITSWCPHLHLHLLSSPANSKPVTSRHISDLHIYHLYTYISSLMYYAYLSISGVFPSFGHLHSWRLRPCPRGLCRVYVIWSVLRCVEICNIHHLHNLYNHIMDHEFPSIVVTAGWQLPTFPTAARVSGCKYNWNWLWIELRSCV